jgi:AcrR family transcriptional regulator
MRESTKPEPAHHFGDKAGLLTAVAAQGYDLLADTLNAAQRAGDFLDVGVAYVRFAIEHRAHFEVTFRPDLYHPDDPAVMAARHRAADALYGGVGTVTATLWVPETRLTCADLLLRQRRSSGMIRRWRCG